MRHLVVLCMLLGLTSCGGSPASLGITGPGASAVPPPAPTTDDSTIGIPGVPATNSYGPTIGPTGGGEGHFFNYN